MSNTESLDIQQFELIFKKYYVNMVSYAYKILNNYVEAEDAVQEVFFSYWKKKDTIVLRSSLEFYLFGAVKRKCQNQLRHAKVVQKYQSRVILPHYHEDDPHNSMVGEEVELTIKKTLDSLPEQTRKIFMMNRFEAKKYKEIALDLCISIKTVEAHMGKVLKLLRSELSDYQLLLLTILILN